MIARIVLSCSLVLAACSKDASKTDPTKAGGTVTPSDRFDIKVTDKGFEPDDTVVPAGRPVTLVFERTTDQTCAKEVIVTLADGSKIEKQLPLDTAVEITTTFRAAGKLGYACGMDMVKGTLTVQ